LDLDRHVLKYPTTVRIQLLSVLLANYDQLKGITKYPVQITFNGWSAFMDSFSGYTLDNWVNALWNGL
jgi:hypothetical protein